jgi:hypothetical protein
VQDKSEAVKVETRKQQYIKTVTSLNDIAVTTLTEREEKQAITEEEKEDYETLDRLIDSITRDFSRKGINSRLKALATKSSRNARYNMRPYTCRADRT